MKYKIPKTGYLYVIKRNNRAFEGSKYEIVIDNNKYDVVPSYKQYSIEQIADIVFSIDNRVFEKVTPGRYEEMAKIFKTQLGIEVNELILG
jgi:ribosome maturation protein Sdo1